jgi:hypothetical protein
LLSVKPNALAGGSKHSAWQKAWLPTGPATGFQVHEVDPAAPTASVVKMSSVL